MIRQYELVERVKKYDPGADEDLLNRAYVFAMKMHGAQTRESGDAFFVHPLEVAGILTDFKLDTASIVTALLHDTVEDTPATLEEIEEVFGAEVARLVDGVTKLTRIELQSEQSSQAENFRKLVLAMSQDIRVLVVKLADRLHNMRTLQFIRDAEKRRRTAVETMEIYVPLAERIGIQTIKQEFEDLAFGELHPDARASIVARLNFLREQGADLIGRITDTLRKLLADSGVQATVTGREKTPYSIWRKMQRKNVAFEQLSDIMAFRCIVDSIEDCYRVLGTIHSTYSVVPGGFKDYISTPKPNGYRSVHTRVYGPEGHRIEVQIRTQEMHEVAEMGVAAHWVYKQGRGRPDGERYRWLRGLLDILEHAEGPDEFLENTKMEMFQDQVFCFTPKGDLIALPRGATPVDFAYAVHSVVGDTCVGAKINGRIMPLRTELRNGDQVEIVTAKGQVPSPAWERFVVTGKARARVRRFIRSKQREQYMSLGKVMLQKAFRQDAQPFSEKAVGEALSQLKYGSLDDLYTAVGEGVASTRDVLKAVTPAARRPSRAKSVLNLVRGRASREKAARKNAVPIRGLIPGMAVHFAGCCHPLPGDRIVGIVTTGKGVTIHTIDCDTLENFASTPERWLDVTWEHASMDDEKSHVGRLNLVITNVPGALSSMTTVIARNEGNISNLKITNRSPEFFEMMVDIEVRDLKHLTNIIAALRAAEAVNYVDRARG
ncbi:MAG: bifunctional (p)ppGpp synthetase/guanosine-3',5'-bis(diphosphate) 3'-pyrophosphohydrolase [Proteobacteria bacterium]|nr:bifunctional (p)ppGpp synthetase/guanosine-3',5'-bis(diphosphate) 3'-pyrophosphohydrolase [Pseudomonadota bacterium]